MSSIKLGDSPLNLKKNRGELEPLAATCHNEHYPLHYYQAYVHSIPPNHRERFSPEEKSYFTYPYHDGSRGCVRSSGPGQNWESRNSSLHPHRDQLHDPYLFSSSWSQTNSNQRHNISLLDSNSYNINQTCDRHWSKSRGNYNRTGDINSDLYVSPGISPKTDMSQNTHLWQHIKHTPLQQQQLDSKGYKHGTNEIKHCSSSEIWNKGLNTMQPKPMIWKNDGRMIHSSSISGPRFQGELSIDSSNSGDNLCQSLIVEEEMNHHVYPNMVGLSADLNRLVDNGIGSISVKGEKDDSTGKDKGRGNYRCGKCGVPKKGHVCPYQPKFKRHPDEPRPVMRNASTQVEMDEFLVLRRLNIEIQGYPESYLADPLNNVVAERINPTSISRSPYSCGPHMTSNLNRTKVGASIDSCPDRSILESPRSRKSPP